MRRIDARSAHIQEVQTLIAEDRARLEEIQRSDFGKTEAGRRVLVQGQADIIRRIKVASFWLDEYDRLHPDAPTQSVRESATKSPAVTKSPALAGAQSLTATSVRIEANRNPGESKRSDRHDLEKKEKRHD